MKLPPLTRLLRENLTEAPAWIEKIITPFNLLLDNVVQALDHRLTFQDNCDTEIKTISFSTRPDYPTFTPIQFKTSMKAKPQGVVLAYIASKDGTAIKNAVTVDWQESQQVVSIRFISGLSADTKYTVRFLVF